MRTFWRTPMPQCRSNKGAPGVDRQDFEAVEACGVERWLGELALALRQETYRPSAQASKNRMWRPMTSVYFASSMSLK